MRKARPTESFFNFFSPPTPPEEDAELLEDEELDELDEKLEVDYQIGEDIKEKVCSSVLLDVPYMPPIRWLVLDHSPCCGLLHRQGARTGGS